MYGIIGLSKFILKTEGKVALIFILPLNKIMSVSHLLSAPDPANSISTIIFL
jgi:hypothetical protein